MTSKNKINDVLGVVGTFVAAHPELEPSKIEFTVQTIVRYLKKQKLEINLANMNEAFARLVDAVEAMREPEPEEPKEDQDVEKFRKQIDSWSADEMKEFCKNPEVLAAVEAVLSQPRKKEQAKRTPAPKAKVEKPVKDPLEVAIDKMTADEMKRALSDPAKAAGIENVLSRRSQ